MKKQHHEVQAKLPQLPTSCAQSADELLSKREVYEKDGVFSPGVIDAAVQRLRSLPSRDFIEKQVDSGDLHIM